MSENLREISDCGTEALKRDTLVRVGQNAVWHWGWYRHIHRLVMATVVIIFASVHLSLAAAPSSSYVHVTSDCLTLSARPELIDSVVVTPEPVTLPNGQASFTITLMLSGRLYGLCFATPELRAAAMALIQSKLGADGSQP